MNAPTALSQDKEHL